MEAMINEYAGLRVAICKGSASSENMSRIKVLERLLDEGCLEDAEVRVAGVMPCVQKPSGRLYIEARRDGQISKGVAVIAEQLVSCGGGWWPGVVVEGFDDFTNEVIGYAINEGGVLYDVIDGNGVVTDIAWRVVSATLGDLVRLRRQNAKPPEGAVIFTEDGNRFKVLNGCLTANGDITFASLAQLEAAFVLEF